MINLPIRAFGKDSLSASLKVLEKTFGRKVPRLQDSYKEDMAQLNARISVTHLAPHIWLASLDSKPAEIIKFKKGN